MASSSSRIHDSLANYPEGFCSDSSFTRNIASKTPRANVASNSPLVSITGGHRASNSGVRTISDDRRPSGKDASVSVS
ncbi:hypothetical protein ACOSQ2_014763 [Xanthoceras sorbifolium]